MKIREAILRAAAHIERNPHLFDFNKVDAPKDCGTPGCVLGWIAFFGAQQGLISINDPRGLYCGDGTLMLGLRHDTKFYFLMDEMCGEVNSWISDAEVCAGALRKYADKYHPAESNFARDLAARLATTSAIAERA